MYLWEEEEEKGFFEEEKLMSMRVLMKTKMERHKTSFQRRYDFVQTLKRYRVSTGIVKYGETPFGEGE